MRMTGDAAAIEAGKIAQIKVGSTMTLTQTLTYLLETGQQTKESLKAICGKNNYFAPNTIAIAIRNMRKDPPIFTAKKEVKEVEKVEEKEETVRITVTDFFTDSFKGTVSTRVFAKSCGLMDSLIKEAELASDKFEVVRGYKRYFYKRKDLLKLLEINKKKFDEV